MCVCCVASRSTCSSSTEGCEPSSIRTGRRSDCSGCSPRSHCSDQPAATSTTACGGSSRCVRWMVAPLIQSALLHSILGVMVQIWFRYGSGLIQSALMHSILELGSAALGMCVVKGQVLRGLCPKESAQKADRHGAQSSFRNDACFVSPGSDRGVPRAVPRRTKRPQPAAAVARGRRTAAAVAEASVASGQRQRRG